MAERKREPTKAGRGVIVGRVDELAELERGLEEARTGRGRLHALVGEGGIGKTRVATEIARRAAERGFTVAWGRCAEAGGAPAFWPWIQILRGLRRVLGRATSGEPDQVPSRRAGLIERLLPELRGPDPTMAVLDPTQGRLALFEDVIEALRTIASPAAPLALLFDDLHAADPSSLALVRFLSQEIDDASLFLLVTYRDHELRALPDRGRAIDQLARDAVYLPLRRFGEEEVRALLAQHAPDVDAPMVDRVLRASEGNVLFVEEIARAIGLGADQELPNGVRDAIARRLAHLDTPTLDVLHVASVMGRDIDLGTVAALVGESIDTVRQTLLRAEAAGVLVPLGSEGHAFSHVLVRDVLYRALPRGRRAELHAKLADVLSLAHAPERALAEIATHLLDAIDAVGTDRALRGSVDAAKRASSMFAFEDAALIAERAFAAIGKTQVDPRLRAEALVVLGEARIRTEQLASGRAACAEAAAIARSLGDAHLLAAAALAYGSEIAIAQVDGTLIELLRDALERLPESELALRAQVLARLAGAEQPADDPHQPMIRARDAIVLARRSGDRFTLRMALQFGGSALVDYADPVERAGLAKEMRDLAVEAGDLPSAFRAQRRLFLDHLEMGDRSSASACADELDRIAGSLGWSRLRSISTMTKACLAATRGAFTEALELVDVACAEATPGALTEWSQLFRAGLALLLDHVEHAEPIATALRDGWRERAPILVQWAAVIVATARARRGDRDGARSAIAPFERTVAAWTTEPAGVALAAELAYLLDDAVWAAELLPIARSLASRFVSWGQQGLVVLYPFQAVVGQLETTLELWDDAFRSFHEAERRSASASSPPALAWSLHWHAVARARSGDAEGATALVQRALAACREVKMDRLAARIERGDARPSDAAPSVPARDRTGEGSPNEKPAGLAFSFRRDGEVWTVTIGVGTTPREIRLKDSRGMRMLAQLIDAPDREMHVMLLGGDGADAGDLGSAGDRLDATAIARYRERIDDVRSAIDEAERFTDPARADKLREELDFLTREVAAGVGAFGRRRKAAAVAERARVNVQRRLKDAIRRIADQSPELGEYLGWTIRTGTFCSYRPPRF